MGENILLKKSTCFAIRVINLYKYLCKSKKEYTLSKQLLRSGTSIGASIREANYAQSRRDFISKMSISLKETNETQYWLELLYETNYITKVEFESMSKDCIEILKILQSSIITAKSKKE